MKHRKRTRSKRIRSKRTRSKRIRSRRKMKGGMIPATNDAARRASLLIKLRSEARVGPEDPMSPFIKEKLENTEREEKDYATKIINMENKMAGLEGASLVTKFASRVSPFKRRTDQALQDLRIPKKNYTYALAHKRIRIEDMRYLLHDIELFDNMDQVACDRQRVGDVQPELNAFSNIGYILKDPRHFQIWSIFEGDALFTSTRRKTIIKKDKTFVDTIIDTYNSEGYNILNLGTGGDVWNIEIRPDKLWRILWCSKRGFKEYHEGSDYGKFRTKELWDDFIADLKVIATINNTRSDVEQTNGIYEKIFGKKAFEYGPKTLDHEFKSDNGQFNLNFFVQVFSLSSSSENRDLEPPESKGGRRRSRKLSRKARTRKARTRRKMKGGSRSGRKLSRKRTRSKRIRSRRKMKGGMLNRMRNSDDSTATPPLKKTIDNRMTFLLNEERLKKITTKLDSFVNEVPIGREGNPDEKRRYDVGPMAEFALKANLHSATAEAIYMAFNEDKQKLANEESGVARY